MSDCAGVPLPTVCRRFTISLKTAVIAILKNYCAKKDIRNDVLHQVGLVANAIPGVEELTCITQRNSRTAINHEGHGGHGSSLFSVGDS